MSQKKNITGKVPETKVAPPRVYKCTKSQRQLFKTKRGQYNEGIRNIIDEYGKVTSDRMTLMIEGFAEELGIEYTVENWKFDERTMQFTKAEEKKAEKAKVVKKK